jgi:hypothetical protein
MRSGRGAVVGDFLSDHSSAALLIARDEERLMGKKSNRF